MANSGKAAPKRADGRPSLYKPEYVQDVEAFCREGAIDRDIADHYSVPVDTIYEWKKPHPEFSEAIMRGKAKPDRDVAGKLIERAMGGSFRPCRLRRRNRGGSDLPPCGGGRKIEGLGER